MEAYPGLDYYSENGTLVSELAQWNPPSITEGEKERHMIYSLLTAALVFRYWNGNKRGAVGLYPFRNKQILSQLQDGTGNNLYFGASRAIADVKKYDFDYLGHNICCIGVDRNGKVIDFDFNHNDMFNNSSQHAESRLVNRLFSLAPNSSTNTKANDWANLLKDVTIYTSLESCSQCSGIMTLGQVKQVVYLQTDPGMYRIGNILYNLTHPPGGAAPGVPAPEPVPAKSFGFNYHEELDKGFAEFSVNVRKPETPFYSSGSNARADNSPSMTSFLCTDQARDIFERASQQFMSYKCAVPTFSPEPTNNAVLTNEVAYNRAMEFFQSASLCGDRGTQH